MIPCPRCNHAGRAVALTTVEAHTVAPLWARVRGRLRWLFCTDRRCSVGYFTPDDDVITLTEMHTTPFPKSDALKRRVCFCFDHTVGAVLADVTADGVSKIRAAIMEACGRGLDDCTRKNPEGRCCLGNVALLLRSNEDGSKLCCSRQPSEASSLLPASMTGEQR
jgi:hypothetical protein